MAWNGPLSSVKIKRLLDEPCRVIAMRDVDINSLTNFITRQDSDITTIEVVSHLPSGIVVKGIADRVAQMTAAA